jgi:predicted lipid carrier protein YhbT
VSGLLRKLPPALPGIPFVLAANRLFSRALQEGELDFLHGKSVRIEVCDAHIAFALSLGDGRLVLSRQRADLTIAGNLYEFLLLLSRQQDPDTLFFKRRLRLQGDTELGLYVKNFLDALEPQDEFKRLFLLLQSAATLYARLPHATTIESHSARASGQGNNSR